MKDFVIRETRSLSLIFGGIALNTFATVAFCLPHNILIGGSTGISRLLNHFWGINLSAGVLGINMILLLLAFIFVGKRFAASIILGSLTYPVMLATFQAVPGISSMVQDPLLATISGGFLMGIGVGMVIRAGGSMGGSDVLPQILYRRLKLPITPTMYALDCTVLLLQCFIATPNEIIMGILQVLIYSMVTNKVLLMGGGQVQFFIFSPRNELIRQELPSRGFGTTLLHGTAGYTNKEVNVLVTALSARYLNLVRDLVFTIDDNAFMTINSVREIDGAGFTRSVPELQENRKAEPSSFEAILRF